MGNFSYCEAVRELMAVPVQLRILALTATPGSKQQTVQHVIDNLHISKLEYRNESDHDVISYVHNRKIELIRVAMGKDAVEISSRFLEVIRPIVARLSSIGVLQNRDYHTLSPCELLEMRDKFRQAPPPDLSHVNYGDIEGYFGVLISLYYIHKLLSSHGIRPAYEMLERKLKQGFFAKFMCKNEVILKARLLMQQSLSRGAPSPKLSKMLEILLEHFKANDPQSSRVIIFSNYRESVRDIMDALANIGQPVRATQFIGQSSGKAMKGQSQKVQQAVLEKFRSGTYNVIVATSIGEEGLDIMEVDLVVSFDANVSPLRMIQRMGRTGRKHDGQVIVLACEGTELKGYLRKQAKSKAINKHMQNGGINSFTFHCSPRMIPHVFKPEVQFIELSIEKFVPREKKVKDDLIQIPASLDKLTIAEIDLLTKYFHSTGENKWGPSLTAFPHFQTYLSRVHKVNHSYRTTMLIDMMQCLQGQGSKPKDSKTSILQDDPDRKLIDITELDEVKSDNESRPRHTIRSNAVFVNCLKLDPYHLGIQTEDFVDIAVKDNIFGDVKSPGTSCIKNDDLLSSSYCNLGKHQEKTCEADETIPETPIAKRGISNEGYSVGEMADLVENKTSSMLVDAFNNDLKDGEFSPRLTNFIRSGVVPESPIDERGDLLRGLSRNKFVIWNSNPPVHLQAEQKISSLSSNEKRKSCAILRGRVFISPMVEEGPTLVADTTNHSFSEESFLGCGEMSESVKPLNKFKRLRKAVDAGRSNRNQKCRKDYVARTENLAKLSSTSKPTRNEHGRGKRNSMHSVRIFIDEEAEVSSEADVSNDEDGEDDSSFDSFIDDRMNSTATSQPGASRIDMMAIYRRSLLSQTPIEGGINVSATFSPDLMYPMTNISENCNSSGKTVSHLQTPAIQPTNQSACKSLQSVDINQITPEAVPSSSSLSETTTQMRSRKRKLTFFHSGYFPNINLEQEFESAFQSNEESMDANATGDILCDDQFYDNLDLDELEAQATSLLKQKLDLSVQKKDTVPQSHSQNPRLFNPSFDLGCENWSESM